MHTFFDKTLPFQSRVAWSDIDKVDIHHITDLESKYLLEIKPINLKQQFIAGRNLIRKISSLKKDDIDYDQYGAPFFIKHPQKIISLSHSDCMVAASFSEVPNGIDIQKQAEKILHIVPKFMTGSEQDKCSSNQLLSFAHFTWSAKEAMFKAYKIGNVDFKAHLFPDIPVNRIDEDYFECTGYLKNDHLQLDYRLFCWRHHDFYIVFALKM